MHIHIKTCAYTFTHTPSNMHTHLQTRLQTHTQLQTHLQIHTFENTYRCTHTHLDLHIHLLTYPNTHNYTPTHTYTPSSNYCITGASLQLISGSSKEDCKEVVINSKPCHIITINIYFICLRCIYIYLR